jgi:hypothetical protein
MILGYYRVGRFEDARSSMKHILKFAYPFRMDNNLVDFGNALYEPEQPINIVYDTWGIPAAMIRGLFEYLYQADGVKLVPHIPPGITELEQLDPIRFGRKRLYLSTVGKGPVTGVTVNGKPWNSFDAQSVFLLDEQTPDTADICIALGGAKPHSFPLPQVDNARSSTASISLPPELETLNRQAQRLAEFRGGLERAGFKDSYEAAHAQLALEAIAAAREHWRLRSEGKLPLLPPASQAVVYEAYLDTAAGRLADFRGGLDQAGVNDSYESARVQVALKAIAAAREHLHLASDGKRTPLPSESEGAAYKAYLDTAARLVQGLEQVLKSYAKSTDVQQRKMFALYQSSGQKRD